MDEENNLKKKAKKGKFSGRVPRSARTNEQGEASRTHFVSIKSINFVRSINCDSTRMSILKSEFEKHPMRETNKEQNALDVRLGKGVYKGTSLI